MVAIRGNTEEEKKLLSRIKDRTTGKTGSQLLNEPSGYSIKVDTTLNMAKMAKDAALDIAKDVMKKKKQPKYRNTKVLDPITGDMVDSLWELECRNALRSYEEQGKISNLKFQQTIVFIVNGVKIGSMRADFTFDIIGLPVVADAKSMATQGPMFQYKKKLLKALYGKDVVCFIKRKFNVTEYVNTMIYASKKIDKIFENK